MVNLEWIKYFFLCSGLSAFLAFIVSVFGPAVYTYLLNFLSELSLLLNAANWKYLAFI